MSGLFKQLTIIGVGLIGGSLARALKLADGCGEIVGCGRNEDELKKAVELGVVDRYDTDPAKAVAGSDIVLIATPLGAIRSVLEAISGHMEEGAILTDAGSAKGCVVDDVKAVFGTVPKTFVPGHPIAGNERSGVEASFPELYRKRKVILTPLDDSDDTALTKIATLWEAAGADVVEMTIEHHDQVLAATSHLPHVLAYGLVDTLARVDDTSEIFQYAAGGFRDFTRIASSSPQMWHDICLSNREALLEILEHFQEDLEMLTQSLRDADSKSVLECFTRAKLARDHFTKLISD